MKNDNEVICKKSLVITAMNNNIIGELVPNKTYNIGYINPIDSEVWIIIDELYQPFDLIDEYRDGTFAPWKYSEYFYTEQEKRKIKLNKLDNV